MIKKYRVDLEIYNEKYISETIKDFEEVTSIGFNKGLLEIEGDSNLEIDEVFNEFMNYLISNINVQ